MSWQDVMPEMVRWGINDLNGSTYSAGQLEHVLIIAAQYLNGEVDFDTTYTINMISRTITPDPTTLTTQDDAFINLTVLKAICIILDSEARTQSLSAMKVTDGPSSIDTTAVYNAAKQAAETACNRYDKAKLDYQMNGVLPGLAITTPTTNEGQVGSTRTFT